MKLKRIKVNKLNNRGAAIVTVIVVSALISIIATTLLYIISRNYQSKTVDYQNKTSFYETEKSLESLKGVLVVDVSEAFEYAYVDTMSNYLALSKGEVNDEVKDYFAYSYTKKLEEIWDKRIDIKSDDSEEEKIKKRTKAVTDIMRDRLNGTMSNDEIDKLVGNIIEVNKIYLPKTDTNKYLFEGIKVSATTDSGYSTYLYTTIGLELPECYFTGSTDGKEIDYASSIKYINWKRYD